MNIKLDNSILDGDEATRIEQESHDLDFATRM